MWRPSSTLPGLCCVPKEYSDDGDLARAGVGGQHWYLKGTHWAVPRGCGKSSSLCGRRCYRHQEENHGWVLEAMRCCWRLTTMHLRYLLASLSMSASACTACTTHLFLFDSVQSVFLFTCANLPVSQDHGSFEFVNQTVEEELYFDAWPECVGSSQPNHRGFTGGFVLLRLNFIILYCYHLLIYRTSSLKVIFKSPTCGSLHS